MELALGADVEIRFEVLAKDDGAAGLALDPQAFGADAALFGRRRLLDRFFVALEPGHEESRQLTVSKFKRKARPLKRAATEPANSRSPAEPVYPWCKGVSPHASRWRGRQARGDGDGRCGRCR